MMQEKRRKLDRFFGMICRGMTWLSVVILVVLIFHILLEGVKWLNWDFLNNYPSRKPTKAGIKTAIWGSVWVISFTALFAIPVGVATAVFLEEYMSKNKIWRILQINIANLAGMPSIIYGLLGLAIFVRFFDFDRSILAGSLTLGLLVLPIIIVASQESIRAVPRSLREAAYALGAMRWQVLLGQVLPAALPGIMTGIILALSRAIGETAPLIIVGALSYVAFVPESAFDPFTVLPIQIFNWAGRPKIEFHGLAAAGIIVLLILLLSMNMIAVFIRHKFQRYK